LAVELQKRIAESLKKIDQDDQLDDNFYSEISQREDAIPEKAPVEVTREVVDESAIELFR
jgi:hypothetical protein